MEKYNLTQKLLDCEFYPDDNFIFNFKDIYDKLKDRGFEVFRNSKKLLFINTYESVKHAINYFKDDQFLINTIIDRINIKYRKNLYFLLCINSETKSDSLAAINFIEKDEYVCKKFILIDNEDFNRVSFLAPKLKKRDNMINDDDDEIFLNEVMQYSDNKSVINFIKEYIVNENKHEL